MPKLFTDEQIELARSVSLESYLRKYEPNNITEQGIEIRLKDHDSLVVSRGLFHWFSRGVGGKGALDYLVKVREYDFKEAVALLLPHSSILPTYTTYSEHKAKQQKPFELPPRSNSTNSTEKYLLGRGIDYEIMKDCISQGSIYQTMFYSKKANRSFPNAVFVGYDENKRPSFACIRSIFGNFKQDVEGSNKKYGFLLPASGSDNDNITRKAVSVFESPIDVLSGATLAKMNRGEDYKGIYRLSLGCVSSLALKEFLINNPKINIINLCLDNDKAGQKGCKSIQEMIKELALQTGRNFKVNHMLPKMGKDYNEMLQMKLANNSHSKKQYLVK